MIDMFLSFFHYDISGFSVYEFINSWLPSLIIFSLLLLNKKQCFVLYAKHSLNWKFETTNGTTHYVSFEKDMSKYSKSLKGFEDDCNVLDGPELSSVLDAAIQYGWEISIGPTFTNNLGYCEFNGEKYEIDICVQYIFTKQYNIILDFFYQIKRWICVRIYDRKIEKLFHIKRHI